MPIKALLRRDPRELVQIAIEALGRYKLRTALSVLGVVLGVAAVIAMMSVSEGAGTEALRQVQALGLDNLVARSRMPSFAASAAGTGDWLTAGDVPRVLSLVPFAASASPLIDRSWAVTHSGRVQVVSVLGVTSSYGDILRLRIGAGRFLSPVDEHGGARVCVLGGPLARTLFGFEPPVGGFVRLQGTDYRVIGVLADQGTDAKLLGSMAWRDLNQAAIVPIDALVGADLDVAPTQPVDEIWLRAGDGDRVESIARVLAHTLARIHGTDTAFSLIVPRELLAQRYRTQRTFSVVVGSVAALALLIGGIGIMNIMLTSVMERTREIGVRRTVGATRRDVTAQFLVESVMMTLGGGLLGIAIGVGVSWGITAYAGWTTRVSPAAIALAFLVSCVVGMVFGLYPAIKAARLEPVEALHYE